MVEGQEIADDIIIEKIPDNKKNIHKIIRQIVRTRPVELA